MWWWFKIRKVTRLLFWGCLRVYSLACFVRSRHLHYMYLLSIWHSDYQLT